MSKTTIPAKTVIKCDCCGAECAGLNYVHEGKLQLTRAALDFQGHPVADASIKLDLCDSCMYSMAGAIDEVVRQKGLT